MGEKVDDNNALLHLQTELVVRRQQVMAYMMMENGYNAELFRSITLTNDLLVTLKDMLKNMEGGDPSMNVMRQMYERKVVILEQSVLESQRKWSVLVADYQSRQSAMSPKATKQSVKENNLQVVKENEPMENVNANDK